MDRRLGQPDVRRGEAAEKELSARLGPSLPYLRETANKTQSAEQRARAQKLLAQWDAQRNVGVEGAEIWVWDPATGEPFPSLPGTSSGHPVRFTPDGEWLITQNGNDGVQAFRTAGGKPTTLWKPRGTAQDYPYPTQPVPLPDAKTFVAFRYGQYSYGPRDLYWFDFGRQIKFGSTDRTVTPLVVSPAGKWVAAGGLERDKPNPVYLWKLPDFGPLDEKLLHGGKTIPPSE